MIPGSAHLAKFLDGLRSSYWFVPTLMVFAAGTLAAGTITLDLGGVIPTRVFPPWLQVGDSEAARAVLSTIAGATITIVSLTFSISIVALSLASNQFGSRLLYNFMRDRMNQIVLGTFLGTFVYCVIGLTSFSSSLGGGKHQMALMGAVLLSLANVGVLIFFIHHVAESIQATNVISTVGRELHNLIPRVLPALDEEADADRLDGAPNSNRGFEEPEGGLPVLAHQSGTLQAVDSPALLRHAESEDLVLWVARRPGDYVFAGGVLARVHGTPQVSDEIADSIRRAVIIGSRRTLIQDLEFGFHQLVEIAVRALSPGINDPFTAMGCIDELGTALSSVAQRGAMQTHLEDSEGRVRVHLDATDFRGVVDTAIDQIRQQAQNDPAVMIHMLDMLRWILPLMRTDEQREAIARQAHLTHELAVARVSLDADRDSLDARLEAFDLARNRR
ncbi:DUF2254 domain-containing protein [Engelhardtia mirabilis]|uniref:DUF2254 domain-containing protein n=1 Tax=Engelhardtia mirabilis TaxID=2528011 RepID=A0A518BNP4_9BACT|nr:hypothetical protein Pla133_36620 [Planctomycetes bacterium Pla133]QDV02888.1 hypothetical protein Pla86_36600 [Planctomycetes bacterium Pla86]